MKLDIGRRQRLQKLLDRYGRLLTEHQLDTLSLYVDKDWSYTEIAAAQGVSRAAVHDLVRRTEATLMEYEQKLGLLAAEAAERDARAQLLARIDRLDVELRQVRRSLV